MNKVQTFDINTVGTDYVVGDIHGEYELLAKELDKIGFHSATDRLFSVGDLVDRGPESFKTLSVFVEAPCYAIRGNHEDFLIKQAGSYLHCVNGGDWFHDLIKGEQYRAIEIANTFPVAIEVKTKLGTLGIVHAEPPDNWDTVGVTREETLLWSRTKIKNNNKQIVKNIDAVVVGHTPVKNPVKLGNTVYLDTGAVFGNTLTIWPLEHVFYFIQD